MGLAVLAATELAALAVLAAPPVTLAMVALAVLAATAAPGLGGVGVDGSNGGAGHGGNSGTVTITNSSGIMTSGAASHGINVSSSGIFGGFGGSTGGGIGLARKASTARDEEPWPLYAADGAPEPIVNMSPAGPSIIVIRPGPPVRLPLLKASIPVNRTDSNTPGSTHIREQHHLSLGSYGRPRMTQELKELGLSVGHRRVGRLMHDSRIYVVITHKYKATTDSHHCFNIAPNVLDRNFTARLPNQKWAGDISYIWTTEGWLYLAVMIDLHSRRVVGWAVSN